MLSRKNRAAENRAVNPPPRSPAYQEPPWPLLLRLNALFLLQLPLALSFCFSFSSVASSSPSSPVSPTSTVTRPCPRVQRDEQFLTWCGSNPTEQQEEVCLCQRPQRKSEEMNQLHTHTQPHTHSHVHTHWQSVYSQKVSNERGRWRSGYCPFKGGATHCSTAGGFTAPCCL